MAAPPPELPADLVEEIFLRLPPDNPRCLFRRLSGAAFRRRYREFYRTPPMLGFLTSKKVGEVFSSRYDTHIVPTVKLSPPGPGRRCLRALDARHGRVLFQTDPEDEDVLPELIIWDPITHQEWIIQEPGPWVGSWSAVLCAKVGCDHLDCHGHPFLVAYLFVADEDISCSALLYSSKTDSWSDKTYVDHDDVDLSLDTSLGYSPPGVLVGNTLYFDCYFSSIIIQYDLADRELSLIDKPDLQSSSDVGQLTVENGVLGFAKIKESSIYLWSRKVDELGAAAWVQPRVIKLETMLSCPLTTNLNIEIYGFAEGVGVIFLLTKVGLFMVDLKSGRATKVCYQGNMVFPLIPYMSFYTPGHDRGIMPLPPGPPAIEKN